MKSSPAAEPHCLKSPHGFFYLEIIVWNIIAKKNLDNLKHINHTNV